MAPTAGKPHVRCASKSLGHPYTFRSLQRRRSLPGRSTCTRRRACCADLSRHQCFAEIEFFSADLCRACGHQRASGGLPAIRPDQLTFNLCERSRSTPLRCRSLPGRWAPMAARRRARCASGPRNGTPFSAPLPPHCTARLQRSQTLWTPIQRIPAWLRSVHIPETQQKATLVRVQSSYADPLRRGLAEVIMPGADASCHLGHMRD